MPGFFFLSFLFTGTSAFDITWASLHLKLGTCPLVAAGTRALELCVVEASSVWAPARFLGGQVIVAPAPWLVSFSPELGFLFRFHSDFVRHGLRLGHSNVRQSRRGFVICRSFLTSAFRYAGLPRSFMLVSPRWPPVSFIPHGAFPISGEDTL